MSTLPDSTARNSDSVPAAGNQEQQPVMPVGGALAATSFLGSEFRGADHFSRPNATESNVRFTVRRDAESYEPDGFLGSSERASLPLVVDAFAPREPPVQAATTGILSPHLGPAEVDSLYGQNTAKPAKEDMFTLLVRHKTETPQIPTLQTATPQTPTPPSPAPVQHPPLPQSRVSLALLLEASAAAAQAEKNAKVPSKSSRRLRRYTQSAPEDQAESQLFDVVEPHTAALPPTPRITRSAHMKPVDRRTQLAYLRNPEWSRYDMIINDPVLNGECHRLVRGTQGCGRECDAKFSTLITFAKHIDKVHDSNFRPFLCPHPRCPWAIIGFHERSECTRHIRTKHYKAMYACDYAGCNKVYNRSDAFRRHVRQAHVNPQSRYNRLNQQLPGQNSRGEKEDTQANSVLAELGSDDETDDETENEDSV